MSLWIPFEAWGTGGAVQLWIKSALVLIAMLALHLVLAPRRPLLCSTAWNAALVALLLLPLGAALLSPLPVHLAALPAATSDPGRPAVPTEPDDRQTLQLAPAQPASVSEVDAETLLRTERPPANTASSGPATSPSQPPSSPNAPMLTTATLLTIYVLGLLVGFTRLGRAWHQLRTLRQSARPLQQPLWQDRHRRWCRKLGLDNVKLLETSRLNVPAAAGIFRPAVLVPAALAQTASPATVDAVLLHELTHIRRADFAWQLAARCVLIIYWLNPLVWLVPRHLHTVQEEVCDRYCTHMLGGRQQYIDVLVELAARLVRTRRAELELAMARSPRIARRVGRLLNAPGLSASRSTRPLRLAVLTIGIAGGLVLGAGVAAAPGPPQEKAGAEGTDLHGDPLPDRAIARLGTIRLRPGGMVNEVGFSSDGQRLVTLAHNLERGRSITVWDAQSGSLIREVGLAQGRVAGIVSTSEQPGMAILRDAHGVFHRWELLDPEAAPPDLEPLPRLRDVVAPLPAGDDRESFVRFAVSPDGRLLAGATGGWTDGPRMVQLWKLGTAGPQTFKHEELDTLRQLPRSIGAVEWLEFSADSATLATLTRDDRGAGQRIEDVRDPDGARTVVRWQVETGEELLRFRVPKATTNGDRAAIALSPDQQTMAIGTPHGEIHLYDLQDGAELRHWLAHSEAVAALAFSPDGSQLVSGGRDRRLRTWTVDSGLELISFAGHHSWVETVAYSPDGRRIASGGQDQLVHLWDATTGQRLLPMDAHEYRVLDVAITPNGRLAVTSGADQTLRFWDTTNGSQVRLIECQSWVPAISISLNGLKLAAADGERVVIHSLETGELLWKSGDSRRYPDRFYTSVSFAPDADVLAATRSDGVIHIWQPAVGGELRELPVDREGFSFGGLSISAGGARLAVVTKTDFAGTSRIHLWDLQTRGAIATWDVAGGMNLNALSFSPDGLTLAAAGSASAGGSFTRDGRNLASPDLSAAVQLWDARTGELIRTFPAPPEMATDVRYANDVEFSPDGRFLLTAERDGSIVIYDIQGGEAIGRFAGHGDQVNAVAISADMSIVVSAASDNTALAWSGAAAFGGQDEASIEP